MRSLGSVGLALSLVFTCLLLALVAEIYYLLWWKRRIIRKEIIKADDDYTNSCKNQEASSSSAVNISTITQEIHFHPQKQLTSCDDVQNGSNFVGAELIPGPPGFLFTIKEETVEEMASERKRNSLNDLMMNNMENITPYATPLSSPPFMTPCSSTHPRECCHSSSNHSGSGHGGYNPLYESSNGAEFNRIVKSTSPPPKFKFLRNAEEKLVKKTMLLEQQVKRDKVDHEGVNGSFITIIVANNKENDTTNNHYHSPLCPSSSSN